MVIETTSWTYILKQRKTLGHTQRYFCTKVFSVEENKSLQCKLWLVTLPIFYMRTKSYKTNKEMGKNPSFKMSPYICWGGRVCADFFIAFQIHISQASQHIYTDKIPKKLRECVIPGFCSGNKGWACLNSTFLFLFSFSCTLSLFKHLLSSPPLCSTWLTGDPCHPTASSTAIFPFKASLSSLADGRVLTTHIHYNNLML